IETLRAAGSEITTVDGGLKIYRNGNGILPVDITTEPFPGFPTDLQAQFMALMSKAQGTSKITETIFENRFMHIAELARLGAH
ncbi:UDP-N-acetylglucosamine 1-carboxyvinyltransferase, partial [Acinetobacter baumannii]